MAERLREGRGVGLLDAGFEEVGGLEEEGGEDAAGEAGGEVEDCLSKFLLDAARGLAGCGFDVCVLGAAFRFCFCCSAGPPLDIAKIPFGPATSS